MAKSTSNPNVAIPKGMMRFEVIRSAIKDSIGQYCVPGDYAVLTKSHAQSYLDNNFIKVALPEFDDESADNDTVDEDGKNSSERAEAESNSSQRDGKRRTRSTVNG